MDKQQNNLQNDTTNTTKRPRLTETLQQEHVTKFTDLKSEWVTPMIKGKPLPQLYGHTCSVIDRYLYIFGGRSTTAPIGPIEGYLVDTTTWEVQEIKSNDKDEVPSHRWGHSAVVVDNRYIFLFGGFTSEYNLGDCWIYDTQTKKWSSVHSPNAPKYRAYHSCVAVGHKLILFGGSACVGGPYQYYNDTFVFDWDTREWQLIQQPRNTKPPGRSQHTCVMWGKYMFVFGGYNGTSVFSDLYALDLTNFSWRAIQTHGQNPPNVLDGLQPEPFRVFPARRDGVVLGSKLFIFVEDPLDIHCLDFTDLKWHKITQTECKFPPYSVYNRASHTCVLVDGWAIIFGGCRTPPQIHTINLLPFFVPLKFQQLEIESLKCLSNDLKVLLNSDDFKDITFEFPNDGNKQIRAHKAILVARCPYFKAMFHSGLAESKQDTIKLREVSYSAFVSLLEFLYTGQTKVNNPTELFELAHHYDVVSLKQYCECEIIKELPLTPLTDILKLLPVAELYDAKEVLQAGIELVAQHFLSIKETELFRSLSSELQHKIEEKINTVNK